MLDRGSRVSEASQRLGIISCRLYQWIKLWRQPQGERQVQVSQADELRRLKAEFKRVTEEPDILKKADAYFAKQSR